jgi:unspecific monooxygenase
VREEESPRFASVTSPQVGEFPVATAVVLETLRLHPPTWLLHRTLLRDADLGGYVAPRAHNLLICPYVMHRDATYFEEPERFSIERWSGFRGTSSSYFPFGRGPHGCPGNEVALVMLVAILLTVLAECEIGLGASEVSPDPRSTLRPAGLEMSFTRR